MPSESLTNLIWEMYCDGASRGNPGLASLGVIVYEESGNPIIKHGNFLGVMTNNEAEYNALMKGLILSLDHFKKMNPNQTGLALNIYMDSELVVKQVKGEYKVKNERLKRLHAEIKNILTGFTKYTIQHVPREKNKEADSLANRALDERN